MTRGQLRIYVGAAAGAGTTYAMLDEALRRQSRGTKVMVACIDTHGRPSTSALLASLIPEPSSIPRSVDLASIVERAPQVVLVDDLGAANPPGLPRAARWQDVDALLEAGFDVISTMTVQHIESLADTVGRIVGEIPPSLVPDEFLQRADQIELIDISPEAIRRRIAHGNVFDRDAEPERSELFNSEAFAQLRILLLQWMIDRLSQPTGPSAVRADIRERVIVAISGAPSGDAVVRRAARIAQRSRAVLIGVHVHRPMQPTPPAHLDHARSLLTELGGTFREIEGADVAAALVGFGELERATQLVVGAPGSGRGSRRREPLVDRVIDRAGSVDVHVVSRSGDAPPAARARSAALSRLVTDRRRVLWVAAGVLAVGLASAVFVGLRARTDASTALVAYFLVVLGIVSTFLAALIATRRSADTQRARLEAASLARLAGSGGPNALQVVADQLCSTFGLRGAAVIEQHHGDTRILVTAGENPPTEISPTDLSVAVADGITVVTRGRTLTVDEHRVLRIFFGQIAQLVEQHHVAELAAEADALARADELRTSILRAVSHDLRSPLASIKASASSLRQSDVDWPDEMRNDFLASIEDETDRLTTIVTNLLDMGRLQAGAIRPAVRATPLEEVLPAAIHSLGSRGSNVDLILPPDLPDTQADPALLERVLANVIANAVEFSPAGERIRVSAALHREEIQIYVVDHGPGIRLADRPTVVQPFHRLSDTASNSGVGLGLAIADGLTTAMGGTLELRDTPRGGLTVVVSLPAAHALSNPTADDRIAG